MIYLPQRDIDPPYIMKARVSMVLDMNDTSKELYGLMISNGRGVKSHPGSVDGKIFITESKTEAKKKAKEFNLKFKN